MSTSTNNYGTLLLANRQSLWFVLTFWSSIALLGTLNCIVSNLDKALCCQSIMMRWPILWLLVLRMVKLWCSDSIQAQPTIFYTNNSLQTKKSLWVGDGSWHLILLLLIWYQNLTNSQSVPIFQTMNLRKTSTLVWKWWDSLKWNPLTWTLTWFSLTTP